MSDYMVRGMAGNQEIRCFAVTSRDLVQDARVAHGTSPVATAALGRALSAVLMMSDMLKNDDDLITIRFDGDGPLGMLIATADHKGNVKGYVEHPDVWLPLNAKGHLDVGKGIGKGTLTVIRDLGMKESYSGEVDITTGEIADDITRYYAESEQIPTSVGLGVLVDTDLSVRQAGGFIVQLMPFAREETIDRLEQNLMSIHSVTQMQEQGMKPEDILSCVLAGFDDFSITQKTPVRFHCSCTKKRVQEALALLSKEELQSLVDEGKTVNIACQFCGKKYEFSPDELKEIKENANN